MDAMASLHETRDFSGASAFTRCRFERCQFIKDKLGGDCKFQECSWYDCEPLDCIGLPAAFARWLRPRRAKSHA